MGDDDKLGKTVGAIKELAEVVPVYQDLMQPAFKEVGQGLQTVAKTINIALSPLKAVVWGYEQIESFVSVRVAEKMKEVPEERIVTPDLNVAGPAVEALRFSGHKEELRDMYASLLATSMDSKTAGAAHPAYVEVIRQLSPDEAKILAVFPSKKIEYVPVVDLYCRNNNNFGKFLMHENFTTLGLMAGCEHQQSIRVYIDNLIRLRLVERVGAILGHEQEYQELSSAIIEHQLQQSHPREKFEGKFDCDRGSIRLTQFGTRFIGACVDPGWSGLA